MKEDKDTNATKGPETVDVQEGVPFGILSREQLLLREKKEIKYRLGKLEALNNVYMIIGIISVLAYIYFAYFLLANQNLRFISVSSAVVIGALIYFSWQKKHKLGDELRDIDKNIDDLRKREQDGPKIWLPQVQSKTSQYFNDLVEINLGNLEAYYELVKVHTDKSFSISKNAGIIGFSLIIFGFALSYFNPNGLNIAAISAASGIIIEFISAIFFYLYNKTIFQLKGYHDSLLDVQNILLSIKLVENIEDKDVKSATIKEMINYLITRK